VKRDFEPVHRLPFVILCPNCGALRARRIFGRCHNCGIRLVVRGEAVLPKEIGFIWTREGWIPISDWARRAAQ